MRLLGHPIHPMLVHVPIGLWAAGSLCDALAAFGVAAAWPLAWFAIAGGTAAALVTMTAGLVDYADLRENAVPTALRHMALMGLAWLLYAAAFLLRSDRFSPAAEPSLTAMILGWAGFAALAAGAWHGGQLVYRFGAGVDR